MMIKYVLCSFSIACVHGIINGETCGGLPPHSIYYVSKMPSLKLDQYPSSCSQWQNEATCCTVAESVGSLQQIHLDSYVSLSNSVDGRKHCYYGYFGSECPSLVEWTTCATNCDARFPRNLTDKLPSRNICYERFTPRVGYDKTLHASYSTACEYARHVHIGNCDAVIVVGDAEMAIALGGDSICMTSGAIFLTQPLHLLLLAAVIYIL